MNPGETVAITFSADPLKIIGVGRVRVEDKLEGFVEINIHESIEFLHKGVAHFERMENPDDSIEYLYLPSSARSYLVDRFLRPTFRIGGWVEEKVETCNHAQQASLF